MTACTRQHSTTPTSSRSWESRTDSSAAAPSCNPLPCDKCWRRRRSKGAERIRVRSAGDTALCADGGDVPRRRDVECGMRRVDVGGDSNALEMCDLGGGALFNRNVLAVRDGKIESGNRGSDVEGNVVLFCQNRDLVGTDFVGRVAVPGDAIRAGDDGSDLSGLQKVPNHIVGDQRERDAGLVQFPSGEARAL